MTPPQAIFFDKDGCLFDFEATWSVWAAGMLRSLAEGNEALALQMAERFSFDLPTARFAPDSTVIAGTVQEQAEALIDLLPHRSVAELTAQMNAMAAGVVQVEVTPLAPLFDIFAAKGIALGVVTNDAESSARAHLDQAGVLDRFAFVAGFDSGHGQKPQAGGLLAGAQALGVDPACCMMVGDSTHDLEAARAAGMAAVGVLTGPAQAATLAPMADVVLDSIAQLPDWIGL